MTVSTRLSKYSSTFICQTGDPPFSWMKKCGPLSEFISVGSLSLRSLVWNNLVLRLLTLFGFLAINLRTLGTWTIDHCASQNDSPNWWYAIRTIWNSNVLRVAFSRRELYLKNYFRIGVCLITFNLTFRSSNSLNEANEAMQSIQLECALVTCFGTLHQIIQNRYYLNAFLKTPV